MKSRQKATPYFRTEQMQQALEPSWAARENAALSALVSGTESLVLPDVKLKLTFAHVAAAKAGTSVAPHLHPQLEWFRVEEGQFTLHAEDTPVTYRRGEIGITPPRMIHHWKNGTSATGFFSFMLSVSPTSDDRRSLPYRLTEAAAALKFKARPERELTRALDGVRREVQNTRADSTAAARAHLSVVLTLLFRQLRDAVSSSVPNDSTPLAERRVVAAEAFVRAHLSEPISVQHVADSIGITARQLNRLLAKAGLGSVSAIIENARMEQARWLLKNTSHPVKTIARLCGYSDAPYFCRVFKSIERKPPTALRK
ncbi:MAG TPA: AraC family transcriptional regulator [Planctomycetota bacterium]|nr:AraC family transcriptional regulator [Planctomycetota bacterium]